MTDILPVLPLRDVVVYPHMVIPLFVGREKSIHALQTAMDGEKEIFLVAQKDPKQDDPEPEELYQVGTVAIILQLLELPDGTVKVLVEGNSRGSVLEYIERKKYLAAEVESLEDFVRDPGEIEGLTRNILTEFEEYANLTKKISKEVLATLANIDNSSRLADTIASHLVVKEISVKQALLEKNDVAKRIESLIKIIDKEIEVMKIDNKIQKRIKGQFESTQREYFLNEKMKAIQKELEEMDRGGRAVSEIEKYKGKIEEAGMPKEAKEKAMNELDRLKKMPPLSAEATVCRNYLDWLLDIPWNKFTEINHDLGIAQKILDEDHYGLEKVKERIIEYLAVQLRVKKVKAPILCLVGPPGVGKTSLGQSIARASSRKFIRVSLGGVRDEAEIRGHRRTYIGSMPGKIMQKMAKVDVCNPLFLLDEVDKIAKDFRGDPSAALLEVLDPEQNNAFGDHFLEVDYDLSDVLFIATANTLDIPPPLLDRMEVIRISGYIENEKLNIAEKYLIPKQMKANGLEKDEIKFSQQAILDIIRYYTREAGVRNLERELSKICRKVVKNVLLEKGKKKKKADKKKLAKQAKKVKTIEITVKSLGKYLGVQKYRYGVAEEHNQVGQVTGLAWTEVGGELLKIEASIVPGKGKSIYTGRLGDVMQESIQAAITVVRSRANLLGIDNKFYQKKDIHIHVPEGATPKDGPSAGISMCTALVSALTQNPVRADVAMTGEITLRGEVLPIGGLKEKLLAALRGGIKQVIIPEENAKELKEIPKNITSHLEIHPVRWIDQVLNTALQEPLNIPSTQLELDRMPPPKKSEIQSDRQPTN